MARTCLIISGGEFDIPENLEELKRDAYVIACDRGYDYALKMDLEPDFVIGDFDSLGMVPELDNMTILPKEKDDTDTMSAVKKAIELGYDDIYILCALGGRFDHTIANVQTLKYIASLGKTAHLLGKDTEVISFKDCEKKIEPKNSAYLSVFSLSDISKGVSIRSAKYELDDYTLTDSFPIGVSNEFTGSTVSVEATEGILMVVLSKKDNVYKRI